MSNCRAIQRAAQAMADMFAARLYDLAFDERDEVRAVYMEALPQHEQEAIWSEVAGNVGPKLTLCIGDDLAMGRVLAAELNDYLDDLIAEAEPDACRLLSETQRLSHADAELDRRVEG